MAAFRKTGFLQVLITISSLFFNLTGHTQPQKFLFNQLSIENGLSNNSVTYIFKDSRGFIWIGTTDGLNLYNGYSFKVFKHEPSNDNSISDDFISAIVEDHEGNLWIGTQGGGLNMYDHLQDKFIRYHHDPENEQSIASNFIFHHNSMLIDRDTILWIGTDNGLSRLNLNNKKFNTLNFVSEVFPDKEIKDIRVLFKGKDDILWIGSNAGLIKYSERTGNYSIYNHSPDDPRSLSNNIITCIIDHGKDKLLVGTEEGLNLFDIETGKATVFYNDKSKKNSISDNSITTIIHGPSGNYWIGTKSGGLNKYDPKKQIFYSWKHDPAINKSLSDNYVDYLYHGSSGILWIATINSGINLVNIKDNPFKLIRNEPKDNNSLSYNIIRSIYEDREGIIWIGTYGGGLNRYDGKNFRHYVHEPDNPQSLSHNIVSSMLEDHNGQFWVGTWGGGVNLLDRKKGIFKNILPDIPKFINDFYEDENRNIWIGGNGGIYIFLQQSGKIIRFDSDDDPRRKLSATSINKLLRDRDGNMWVSTWNGLNEVRYDSHTYAIDTIIQYLKELPGVHNLTDNRIITMHEDSRNNLWLGTYSGGLNRVDLNALSGKDSGSINFDYFTEKEGLAGNTVYGILEDNHGDLWISTNNGLSKFDPVKRSFNNYDADDGLQGNQFYWKAYCRSLTGALYFGGLNGMNIFFPDSVNTREVYPELAITGLQLFNKPVHVNEKVNGRVILDKPVSMTDKLVLTRKDYAFSIEFTALTFRSQKKIKYQYKLEGFDPGWITTDSKRRFATYSHLRPGTYTFSVRSTGKFGVWNSNFKSLTLEVLPAWWETTWAFVGYGLIIFLLLLFFRNQILARARYKHRLQLERIERQQAGEYNDLKLRFFTNISHEFRTPLTLILGPLNNLLGMEGLDSGLRRQLTFMNHGGRRLLRLINQVLNIRKVETGNFELYVKHDDVIPLLRSIAQSFKSQAVRNKIRYSMKMPATSAILWYDENVIETVVYNLLSNAFKFTPHKGIIRFVVEFYDESGKPADEDGKIHYLHFTVSDTGVGIPNERLELIFRRFYQIEKREELKRGTGIGLALSKDLIDLHHGSIEVESVEGAGTTFSVTLPVTRTAFTPDEIELIDEDGSLNIYHPPTDGREKEIFLAGDEDDLQEYEFKEPDTRDAPGLLIIEDDAELVRYLGQLLEEKYRITVAANGKKGMDTAIKQEPDLIISDVMMPEKDGYDVCREIKHDIRLSHIPVILLTALSSEEARVEGISAGADAYISKPFNPTLLLVQVEKLLEQRKQLRDFFRRDKYMCMTGSGFPPVEEKFMKKIIKYIETSIADTSLSVDSLSREMNISSTHLYRKIKQLTGFSTNGLIRKIRMEKAAALLTSRQGTISEVMYEVGFSSPSYFSKCFMEEFGRSPKEFIAQHLSGMKK